MPAKTLAALKTELTTLQAVIAKAQNAASLGTEGQNITYQNLQTLYDRESRLQGQIAQLEGRRPRVSNPNLGGSNSW